MDPDRRNEDAVRKHAMISEWTASERAAVEAVERLMTEYAWSADHRDAQSLAELFALDGRLWLGGHRMQGRTEIAAFCGQRFSVPGRQTRHVWSNLRLGEFEGQHLKTTSLQLTFEQSGETQPVQVRVSDVSDEWQRDAQGRWRLAWRTVSQAL